jgi:hypothetical protein
MMLIADGGGGYGGTDWMSMDVVQMWQAVENQDTSAYYDLLDGWRKSYELVLEHMGQVENYRDNLAAAWPPEKSAASAAYVEQLDGLLKSLQATYDAAVANHTTFSSAILALSLSRQDVKKVYDEYTANQTKLAEFKSQTPAFSKYVAPRKPPVADGRQEQLNNQARSIMFGLSSEIIQAQGALVKPTPYVPSRARDTSDQPDGGTYVPPAIPPIVPSYPESGSQSSSSVATGHSNAGNATSPSAADPSSTNRPPGLVLGGVNSPPATVPPPTTGVLPPPPNGGGPQPGVISPGGVLPPGTPLPSGTPSGGVTRGFGGGGLGKPLVGEPVGGLRAMPPGGVIGGTPGIGLGQPGRGPSAPQRVNPVGGVLNPNESSKRSGSLGRGTASGQSVNSFGRRNSDRRVDADESIRWDPENPWETDEGVDPVVLPSIEQRIDPGPAIGLR